ncbi:hypothetical protein [Gilliamella sp. wkB112]|uniref:hypothetical protein n=1 Tax=Gilliamella sp. wkB112 TaxID=3120257 RepID=UPI00080E5304|nr:hypothetical protein [Gilliamella apicola]OCG02229.1 hypothetical protein A9G12_10990 [Gilliamella apicola]
MKKLVFICCNCIWLLFGCDTQANNHTQVRNSYNALSYPEFIPNDKVIVKQVFISYIPTNDTSIKTVIEANQQGLITKVIAADEIDNVNVDYSSKSIDYQNQNFSLNLDKHDNITTMIDNNRQSIVEFNYDKFGQLINKTDNTTLESIITSFNYVNNKLVSRSQASEGSCWLAQFFYNKSGWLIESVMASNHDATDSCPEPN